MIYKKGHILFLILSVITTLNTLAQDSIVADNMLMFQRSYGGWPKHYNDRKIDYSAVFSEAEKAQIIDDKNRNDGTIDNAATTKEIRYLLKAYNKFGKSAYLTAAENGIRYLLKAQYKNGGWPQFYPDLSSYRHQITYNDNAMINALNILWDLVHQNEIFIPVDKSLIPLAEKAIKRGVECILKTQIKARGKLTAWCAQYDEFSLRPDKARKFEPASISGMESVAIVEFLMKIEKPDEKIINAVQCAITWFEQSKITGYKYEDIEDASMPKGKDRVIISDEKSVIWARFYDIETNEAVFMGRDEIPHKKLTEIEHERRIGYAWYGTWPKNLISKLYPEWLNKNGLDKQ